ncbi:MAG TPA: hypothetical protein PLN54_11260 [Flavobacteriales bacterium]|nr:hypothetical protein [Flavobacteriales bacterium]
MKYFLLALLAIIGIPGLCQSFLDPTFAVGGVYTQDLGTSSVAYFSHMIVQPDGRSIAVANGSVTRLTEAGELDPSFANQGVLAINADLQKVALYQGGKIVAAGAIPEFIGPQPCLVRLTTNGQMDGTFGTTGMATFPMFSEGRFKDVEAMNDGRLVALGNFTFAGDYIAGIVRTTASGALDVTFSGDGFLPLDVPPGLVKAIAVQQDGKILLCGNSANGIFVARFGTNGSVDASFNGTGMVSIPGERSVSDIVVQSGGGIILGGITTQSWVNEAWLMRLTSTGSIDQVFGSNGSTTIALSPTVHASSAGPVLAPDGSILLGGGFLFTSGMVVGRPFFCGFTPSGQLDPTFGVDGIILDSLNTNGDFGMVAMAPNGRFHSWGGTSNGVGGQGIMLAYRRTPVGLNEPSWERSTITVYPNPASNKLIVEIPLGMNRQFILLDPKGSEVGSGMLPSDGTLSIGDLSPGMYRLVVLGSGISVPFVVQR